MELLDKPSNVSETIHSYKIVTLTPQNAETPQHILELVNIIFLSGFISLFGICANIMNLIVFYQQGLNTTTNISLFALALSDLSCLVLQQWHIVVSLLRYTELPIMNEEFQFLTAIIPHETFSRVTCSITVFITAERCLCVVFPLSINKMITLKRATLAIVFIYITTLISWVPFYNAFYIDWRYYPDVNITLLGAAFTHLKRDVETVIYFTNVFFAVLSFVTVVIFTSILIFKLREVSAWRESANAQRKKSETVSNRDRRALTMVVMIAIVLVVCYMPSVVLCLVTVSEPEFSIGGKYFQIHQILWTFAVVFENINSSVNIFLYLKMSSKYRATFKTLFTRQKRLRASP